MDERLEKMQLKDWKLEGVDERLEKKRSRDRKWEEVDEMGEKMRLKHRKVKEDAAEKDVFFLGKGSRKREGVEKEEEDEKEVVEDRRDRKIHSVGDQQPSDNRE